MKRRTVKLWNYRWKMIVSSQQTPNAISYFLKMVGNKQLLSNTVSTTKYKWVFGNFVWKFSRNCFFLTCTIFKDIFLLISWRLCLYFQILHLVDVNEPPKIRKLKDCQEECPLNEFLRLVDNVLPKNYTLECESQRVLDRAEWLPPFFQKQKH